MRNVRWSVKTVQERTRTPGSAVNGGSGMSDKELTQFSGNEFREFWIRIQEWMITEHTEGPIQRCQFIALAKEVFPEWTYQRIGYLTDFLMIHLMKSLKEERGIIRFSQIVQDLTRVRIMKGPDQKVFAEINGTRVSKVEKKD